MGRGGILAIYFPLLYNGKTMDIKERIEVSLVVPCYNEAENVRLFQQEVQRVFSGAGLFFEIVFVDDGSRDDTLPRLNAMFEESVCPMQIISFTRNFGKEAAMLAGLKAARGEYITLIDGDLQQRPEVADQPGIRLCGRLPEQEKRVFFSEKSEIPFL